jgi:hypothetical protein
LAVVLGLLIIVGVLPQDRRYFLSAIFGALFVALVDPGGEYANRLWRLAVFAQKRSAKAAPPVPVHHGQAG